MSIRTLSERFGFVAAFDEISGKVVWIAERLSKDKEYMEKKGYVILDPMREDKNDLSKQK